MKKIILIILLIGILAGAVAAWIFMGPGTAFKGERAFLYIRSNGPTKEAILDSIRKNDLVRNEGAFNMLAERMNYWSAIKPGKYEIRKGMSLLNIVRMLRNGNQATVNLVITKIRTKEDLARIAGNRFEFDSTAMMKFLNSPDSLASFDAVPENALWVVMPDTYAYFWNTTPRNVYTKLAEQSRKFWTAERRRKADSLGITPQQAYIIGSIVEEETNYHEEKDTIASVYLNRLKKGMTLGADPTIKFALKDFSIKWIHGDHLKVVSPYNTYKNPGLPPGPICTPSKKTLEAVLAAPQTPYLFFVANSNFSGSHLFSTTFTEHQVKARAFQLEDKRRRELKEKQNAAK
jgi:UPF0755 protein